MKEVEVELTENEFSRINGMTTADPAIEICKIHLRRLEPGASFLTPTKGADLRVRLRDGVETDLEVKGTEKVGIAWYQFKVSSRQSHDLLLNGTPLYRVTEIGSRSVRIFIMRHGVDFEMSPEPRWNVHKPGRRPAGSQGQSFDSSPWAPRG